jgi:hypothetical protein
MTQVRDSGIDKHVTLLLGAGASSTSGLPGWDELAVRLLMRSRGVSREIAERLVAKQDPLMVAEAARREPGANWNRRLRAALYEGVPNPSPSALHLAVAGHLLDGAGDDTTLLTLNFDTLLESAIREGTSDPVEARADGDEVPGAHVVRHLHGIVSTTHNEQVILTLSDFNDLIGTAESWQLGMLREAVARGALVIAGTSYRDPDLRRWLHVAFAHQPPEHAALVLLARQAFELPHNEFDEIKEVLVAQWQAAGLVAILVQDHTDAAQILRELRHLHEPKYVAPQDRAREIWAAHAMHFDRLQRAYSDQLDADAAELRAALGVPSLNLTFWLANGEGQLARWTAQDRYYRNLLDLRLVSTGHDSQWISGRALGAEEILFQELPTGTTRRWRSVLAVPLRVGYRGFPEFASAVISVGLPGRVRDYEDSRERWLDAILTIANSWSTRIVTDPFVGSGE